MLIHEVMSEPVITARPEDTIAHVYDQMMKHGIRHIPVRDERVKGIVTDRDLRRATSALHEHPVNIGTPVSEVMIRDVVMAAPRDPIEEAARLMRRQKIGCLPVMDDDVLVGIVTGMDLLDAIIKLTGLERPSGRLEVRLPDEAGRLARLIASVSEMGVNIHSLLTYPQSDRFIHVILRINTIRPHPVAEHLRETGYDVVWPVAKPWSR
jgi:acetoin utilization protein AcuB